MTLELKAESYRYPGYARSVLRDISLTIADGETVGLIGPNEAGKSTLCLVASGLAPASVGGELRGSLTIDGEPMAKLATYELAERVVVGFQNPNTQRSGISATVFEEVALGPMNLGLNIEETVERTWAALRLLRLEAIAERNPARLSGGQAQLVGIASLLAMRPGHVILDEPTAQLDPAGTRLVAEALRQLADAGTSLLVAEHKTDLLDGLCARMIVINDGQIVRDGPTADVLADPMLVELGVEPPARVRLQRALADAGLDTTVGLEREKLEGVVLEEARAAAAILPPALEGDR
jgi:energy-coupling factor transporter ATP-binding protein EcfA2